MRVNEKYEPGSWEEYYETTKDYPPSDLLINALGHVAYKNKAIDIGSGGFRDTRHLLSQGFSVTAIDKLDLTTDQVRAIGSDNFQYFGTSFADFDFPKNMFDIANAIYSLPFNPPDSFVEVFERLKQSLIGGGVFCGQLFGVRDEWNKNQSMTFLAKDQVERLLSDMEIILLEEVEEDGVTANGALKHWHVYNIIAKAIKKDTTKLY